MKFDVKKLSIGTNVFCNNALAFLQVPKYFKVVQIVCARFTYLLITHNSYVNMLYIDCNGTYVHEVLLNGKETERKFQLN